MLDVSGPGASAEVKRVQKEGRADTKSISHPKESQRHAAGVPHIPSPGRSPQGCRPPMAIEKHRHKGLVTSSYRQGACCHCAVTD